MLGRYRRGRPGRNSGANAPRTMLPLIRIKPPVDRTQPHDNLPRQRRRLHPRQPRSKRVIRPDRVSRKSSATLNGMHIKAAPAPMGGMTTFSSWPNACRICAARQLMRTIISASAVPSQARETNGAGSVRSRSIEVDIFSPTPHRPFPRWNDVRRG
jgi:hypothetical protein